MHRICAIRLVTILLFAYPVLSISTETRAQQNAPNPPAQNAPHDQQPPTPTADGKSSAQNGPSQTNTEPKSNSETESSGESKGNPNSSQPSSSAVSQSEPKAAENPQPGTGKKTESNLPSTSDNPPPPSSKPDTVPHKTSPRPTTRKHISVSPPENTGTKTSPESAPKKKVVREGGATEPESQIVSGMPPEEAARERQTTDESLDATDQTLRELTGRSFNDQQKDALSQVQNYMKGARRALHDGDISRAQTLALKAKLLAEDLAKH